MLKLGISIRGKKNAIKLRFNNKSKNRIVFHKRQKKTYTEKEK